MTYRLRAFHLWRFMRVVHIDDEGEDERAALVHAWPRRLSSQRIRARNLNRHTLVRSDGESKVQKVGRVGKVGDHGRGEIKLSQILCREVSPSRHSVGEPGAYLFAPVFVQHSSWASSSTPPPQSSSCSISYFRDVSPPGIKMQEIHTLIMVGRRSCKSCGSKVCFGVRAWPRSHARRAHIKSDRSQ